MKELLIALGVLVSGALGITNASVNQVEQIKDVEAKVVTTVILKDDLVKDWRVVKDNKTGFLVAKGHMDSTGEAKKQLPQGSVQIEFKTMDGNGEVTTETIKVPNTLQLDNEVTIQLPISEYDRVVVK